MMKEINNDLSITNSMNMTQKSKLVHRQCEVCGAPALFINFGIISCSSCKMFFKRNAELRSNHFLCELNGHCEINIFNRRTCPSCRLAKCFASGMQIILIRSSRTRTNIKKQTSKIRNEMKTIESNQLPTLNLLREDRSTLSLNQRLLISNLINCYDVHDGLSMAHRFISEQNALPLKLRYKYEPVTEFITSNMIRVLRIFEKNFDYLSLCSQDRSILLRNTVKHTGCIGGTLVLHQAHLFDNPFFYKSYEVIFGTEVMLTMKPVIDTLDSDIIFMKLILTIIAFSTTSYTIYTKMAPINFTDLKTIIHIQDTYIEVTWRYLVYKYSYEQAVKRFCNLLRFLFNINVTVVTVDKIPNYSNMIDTVVEQIEQLSLTNNCII